MLETLGFAFIAAGCVGLTIVGLYGLAPDLMPGRRARSQPIRIQAKNLLQTADLTPVSRRQTTVELRAQAVAPRMADDLFAEFFALRAAVAAMTDELRAIRERVHAVPEGEELRSAQNAA
jgi:hypothetical protein